MKSLILQNRNAVAVIMLFVSFFLVSSCGTKSKTGEAAEEQREATNVTTLEDLFANKSKYNGQKITVTGKVTKVNKLIMDRNWVHLQDDANRDLTVTTNDEVNVGDVASFVGVIATDKDFGEGYKYEIIMEDAALVK